MAMRAFVYVHCYGMFVGLLSVGLISISLQGGFVLLSLIPELSMFAACF